MNNKRQAQQSDAAANTARLDAFHVKNVADKAGGPGEKSYWTKIGVAFPHADGKGFNVVLDCMPFNGEVVLRLPEPREEPR
jgi:hypothetical protein